MAAQAPRVAPQRLRRLAQPPQSLLLRVLPLLEPAQGQRLSRRLLQPLLPPLLPLQAQAPQRPQEQGLSPPPALAARWPAAPAFGKPPAQPAARRPRTGASGGLRWRGSVTFVR
jgi:hypothetical protein